jgi:hypothetical protein
MSSENNFPFLPIELENDLVNTERNRSQKKGMDNDDDYYNEVNPNGEVVATYHIWHYMQISPPLIQQFSLWKISRCLEGGEAQALRA